MKPRIGRSLLPVSLFVVALVVVIPGAHAAFAIDSLVGGSPTGVNYANFDNLPLGAAGGTSGGIAVSFTGGSAAVTGTTGSSAAPFLSNNNGALFGDPNNGPDTTVYLAAGGGTVVLSLPGPEKYIGLLWGSVDSNNTLTFYSGGVLGTDIGTITGTNVTTSANGNQGASGTFYVNINSTLGFDTVVASNSGFSFEFDNVAYNPTNVSLPEPSSLVLGCLTFVSLGLFACARHRFRRCDA